VRALTTTILAAALLSSCAFDHAKDGGEEAAKSGGAINAVNGRAVSYKEVFGAVIAPRCVSCHNPGKSEGGVVLVTFEQNNSAAARIDKSVFVDKSMPKGSSLSEQEAQLLRAWLDQGATKEGRSGTSGSKQLQRVAWATVRDEIFAKKCFECHSQPRPEKNLDLMSVGEARANVAKIFDRAVITQNEALIMPLAPVERLTIEEKQILATWIAQGMPE
jgi:uncharacterized membrane protein